MSDFPPQHAFSLTEGGCYSTATALLGLTQVTVAGSVGWPVANQAIFVPMRLAVPVTVYKMATAAGGTATGNFDVGIYDALGNRLVSSGATAKGNSVEHIVDVTDTRLGPGLYYLAMSADGTNNYIQMTFPGVSPVPEAKAKLAGTYQMATAYTLPSTATFATRDTGNVPMIAAYFRSY